MNMEKAEELLDKYNSGEASAAEKALVETWYLKYKTDPLQLDATQIQQDHDLGLVQLTKHMNSGTVKIKLWPRVAAAAMLVLAIGAGLFFYVKTNPSGHTKIAYSNGILPGSNKAILTLSDGSKISLNDAVNGQVAVQFGTAITKTAAGQIVYAVNKSDGVLASRYNILETPKGGQYQVVLPDGTKVWLNAASTLKYPTVFSKQERKVALKGEAYFEVAHISGAGSAKEQNDKYLPFIVTTEKQEVKVLGTHFNINSYADEPNTKTTLLEGSVQVSTKGNSGNPNFAVLKPGEQSIVSAAEFKVVHIDPEVEVAWKNGRFMFNDERIESIMRKIARWYDVTVVYEGKITSRQMFGGTVNRFSNVAEVLEMLELTNAVSFKIEGKKITVLPGER